MCPADQLVQVGFKGAGGLIGADGGEVRGDLAIEQAEVAKFFAG